MGWEIRLPRAFLLSLAEAVALRRALSVGVELNRIEVQLDDLPPDFDGFCIAQVSDLHIGEDMWHPAYAEEAARMVQSVSPDLLINTGDYFQWEPPIDKVAAIVKRFLLRDDEASVPRNLPILGNHDYYVGPSIVADLKDCL